jgi:hypothetical protein
LYPDDPLIAAYHDMLVEQCKDIETEMATTLLMADEDAKVSAFACDVDSQ